MRTLCTTPLRHASLPSHATFPIARTSPAWRAPHFDGIVYDALQRRSPRAGTLSGCDPRRLAPWSSGPAIGTIPKSTHRPSNAAPEPIVLEREARVRVAEADATPR